MRESTHKVLGGLLAAGLLIGANAATAATVILDGDTATDILDLEVDGFATNQNVEFLFISGNDLYDNPPPFPYSADQAIALRNAVNLALNDDGRATRVGPSASQDALTYGIGYDVTELGAIRVQSGNFLLDTWIPATDFRAPGDEFIYADFSPVPVPAAVWLLGSGLVALGAIARRRRMTA